MYYKVIAKCGHVGKNNYILKSFYISASSSKDAASKVKSKPRVKHNHKDVIRDVKKIEYEEFIKGLKIMASDKYFNVHSPQEQKIHNCVMEVEILPEIKKHKYKKERNGQRIKYINLLKESTKIIQGGLYND